MLRGNIQSLLATDGPGDQLVRATPKPDQLVTEIDAKDFSHLKGRELYE
jgi:hypothetical protein